MSDFLNKAISSVHELNLTIITVAPTSFTGIGILFTFIGLTVGLNNFESETIDQLAILKLIAGLRTAFASSITGIIASIMTSVVIRDLMIRYG